jgi:hypothetical protein
VRCLHTGQPALGKEWPQSRRRHNQRRGHDMQHLGL